MKIDLIIELPTGPYYSDRDEDIFFRWLESIPSYLGCSGVGRQLFVKFDRDKISEDTVDELVALLRRYFPHALQTVRLFEDTVLKEWITNPERYFHADVYGGGRSKENVQGERQDV